MIITMGLVNYPHVEDYWATYWPYATPTFSKVTQYYTMYMYLHAHVHVTEIMIFHNNSQNKYTCNHSI